MSEKLKPAGWGAKAHAGEVGKLPTAFPRTIGPRAMEYLQEVVDSGLTCDMMGAVREGLCRGIGGEALHRHPGMHPGPGGAGSLDGMGAGR